MAEELSHWVRKCKGRRVLLVGDLILDRYLYGDAERISPEAPVPVLKTVETREAVGGAGNVAACLRALGCKVACFGVIGRDTHGQRLKKLLSDLEVEVDGILELEERPTTTKTRLVGLAQHRHRQQLLRVDEEDASPLSKDASANLASRLCESINDADVICIEDYDKGVVSKQLVQTVLRQGRAHNTPVLVDPARLRSYDRYAGVDVVTPNREELSIATGRTFGSLEDVATAGRQVLADHDIQAMVATLDREGAMVLEGGEKWTHLPTIPRSVYDNTGAGDAVLAMLAAAISAGADLQSAAKLANVAGGLEVEKFGCVPITDEEVLAELRLEEQSQNGKLRTREELLAELVLRRDRGETVAFTNGCFDVLHAGHVDFLSRCRKEASTLVVGVNSDASVRALNKEADRPINTFENRAIVLGALECVDYVVGFEEATPEALIRSIQPDVLAKGEDWADKGIVGAEFVESTGGRVILIPLVEGLSTSRIIEKIRAAE